MCIGTSEEAGIGEKKAGGMFLFGDGLKKCAIVAC
jgi:hypothetical protein